MKHNNPFNRYSYTLNEDTGEIETPDVFLLDKKLHKQGILYPVTDFRVLVNVVDADEISFSFHKYYNGEKQELYHSLITNSVVYVRGFGYFQMTVSEIDSKEGVLKTATGVSLANCELSDINATVEINTEDDTQRDDYLKDFPTVFYRPLDDEKLLRDKDYWKDYPDLTDTEKKKIWKESSLLHRILSYAPHYKIGHVDETLHFVQRQFSFNTDIHSCLQEIAQEVGCIFIYRTTLDENNETVREINAYETCYCTNCYKNLLDNKAHSKTLSVGKYRSVTNGICNNCGSSDYIYDYGDDTDVLITTENLTDEITVEPENKVKNCFKISGGDELITSAVRTLSMSSSNRIFMFSEEDKAQMSDELRENLNQYDKEYAENEELFSDIVETEYNVIDMIQYLQSGKMPLLEDDVKGIQDEISYLLHSIQRDYDCKFYVSSYERKGETGYVNHAYTSAANAIRNLFTLYLDKGYSVKVTNGNEIATKKADGQSYINWNGVITVYETDDRYNNYADIHILKDGESYTAPDGTVYSGTYVEYGAISSFDSNSNLIENYNQFHVSLGFGDTDNLTFKKYIEQFCESKLASYKNVEYTNREEKDWSQYSYERLLSFHDAYEECLNALTQIRDKSTEKEAAIVNETYNAYAEIQADIEQQMVVIRNQLNALYEFYGIYPETDDINAKSYIKHDYSYDLEALGLEHSADDDFIAVLKDMADNTSRHYIGDKPIACRACGSSNVALAKRDDSGGNITGTYPYCKSCSTSNPHDFMTYGKIAGQIVDFIDKRGTRKYGNNYYLDVIGESVYGSYLSPSALSYDISLKDESKPYGYILSSPRSNSIEPFLSFGRSGGYFITTNEPNYFYLIENQESPVTVELRYHSGGKLIKSYTIPSYGILRLDTGKLLSLSGENYELLINIIPLYGASCTVFKCFDAKGDSVFYHPVTEDINYRGMYVWCSAKTYRNINFRREVNSIESVHAEREKISKYFSLERYLGDELYRELLLYIREDTYDNPNYTSDGCLTNADLIARAKELLTKAKQELAKACHQQFSISSNLYSIVAMKYRNHSDESIREKIYDEYDCFRLGNWLRARLDNVNYHGDETDDDRYKLRLMSIQFDFTNFDKTSVTYSNVERNTSALVSDIRETLETAKSIASSYDYVASQAEQGEAAGKRIDNILKNGYDSSLAAINAGENQDITMDRHGLLFRHYLPETDNYSDYQMKMINRNIVMTKDNWKNASLAIGLGRLPDGTEGYGIWADNIIGSLFAGNQLKIYGGQGEDGKEEPKVVIDENGITLDGGAIRWTKKIPSSSVDLDDTLSSFVSKTIYNQDISDLQNQIDGNITTWFDTHTPSADNKPAVDWVTNEEKIAHKDDLFYCTDENNAHAYRYDYDNADGEYKWIPIKDAAVTKALADAAKAQYTAEGKRRVFVTTPKPPYDVGDLWVQGNGGDILKCKTPKGSDGQYEETDWEKASKYTDNTMAEQVKNSLTAYKTEIEQFKTKINASLYLNEFGEDYVITPKIGGGYLYIANGNYSVEIDPKHAAGDDKTKEGYLFCIRDKIKDDGEVIMGVTTSGDGYFSGEIQTTAGNIGGWNISNHRLETTNNSSIYQYSSNINNSPAMRIINGKATFSSYAPMMSEQFDDTTYVDVSRDGIYVGADGHGADYLFAAKTVNNEISFGSFASTKFHNTPRFYGGFRMYFSDFDYTELGVTVLDSSAANAYFLVKNSMGIKNRLQVGNIDSFYTNHALRVNGDSFITGASYTNNGTAVTSDQNKKNSIASPSDNYISLFDLIHFRKFKYNDGTSDRYHLGVIAQELEEAMDNTGISSQDFAGLVIDENGDYFVRYDEINILTALKVKQLENKINQLEEKLNNLTTK